MPNRLLRDGILRSRKVFQLGPQAEVFYRRLMSVVDDFGRYYADPILLLSDCFPLRPTWADEDSMSLWIEECRASGLIVTYCVSGKRYLEILNFGQRVRNDQRSKFTESAGNSGNFRELPGTSGNPRELTVTSGNFPESAGNSGGPREISAFARATTTPSTTTTTTPPASLANGYIPNPLVDRYQDFLAQYPNPTRSDEGCRQWISLVHVGVITESNLDQIFQGLERWKVSRQWANGKKHAIPTWLEGKMWQDHPEPKAKDALDD